MLYLISHVTSEYHTRMMGVAHIQNAKAAYFLQSLFPARKKGERMLALLVAEYDHDRLSACLIDCVSVCLSTQLSVRILLFILITYPLSLYMFD